VNNNNKIVNLGYQLATIIIELKILITKNLHLYLLLTIKMKIIMGKNIIK